MHDKKRFLLFNRSMIIVIGLGNPGTAYARHRHNVGFQVLDAVAEKESFSFSEKGLFSATVAQSGELLLAKPTTFMNHSGVTARALLKQYTEAQVVVVYDDIDISLGSIKCSFGRGAGGHNGVQSIIDHLGHKDFFRIRVGVRPIHEELADRILPPDGFQKFLLSNFAPFEKEKLEEGIVKAIAVIEALPHKSKEEIMTAFN